MATDKSLAILKRFLDNHAPSLEEAVEAFTPLTAVSYTHLTLPTIYSV